MEKKLAEFRSLMEKENLHQIVIDTFSEYYKALVGGETGKLSKSVIKAPSEGNVTEYDFLSKGNPGDLEKLAVVKLNGGLGTSMGLKKAKSLLPVKGELNFLDIIANQILVQRKKYNKKIPLLFMNSFNTSEDTLNYISKYSELKVDDCPLDFVQNKFPKIKADNYDVFEDEINGWNPPGHGDIYMSFALTGIIDKLLEQGYEYAFVSNSDNLGAVIDVSILSYMKENGVPFLMEVCKRTEMDKKGGHLAEDKEGKLILREVAQCPEDETEEFQDIKLYRYFNTNNIWIDLKALKAKFIETNNVMLLPLIVNPKKVGETDVIQLETAMGAAINLFRGAQALVVPRTRFAPVKKTNDLLTVWSDFYALTEDYTFIPFSGKAPIVNLDSRYYKTVEQLEEHFPSKTVSLKDCTRLHVNGEVSFANPVVFTGNVDIKALGKVIVHDEEMTDGKYEL